MIERKADIFCKEIKKHTNLINPIVLENVDSTNSYAKALCREGAVEGDCVFALSQSGGRGRLGRSFFSYEGGIYMSLILKPTLSADSALFITTSAAVAVAEAVEKLFDRKTQIKWVNDIYIDGKKICGILTEGVIGADGTLDYAVLGIGINLGAPGKFPEYISSIAASVLETEDDFKIKAKLIAKIVETFFEIYKMGESKDYMSRYKERSYLKNKKVEFIKDGNTYTADVLGIDDNAGLILSINGEKITLSAGEVSVRQIKD